MDKPVFIGSENMYLFSYDGKCTCTVTTEQYSFNDPDLDALKLAIAYFNAHGLWDKDLIVVTAKICG